MSKDKTPRPWDEDAPASSDARYADPQGRRTNDADGPDITGLLFRDLRRLRRTSQTTTRQLLQELADATPDSDEWLAIRNRIAEGHQRLVVHIAKHHRPRGMDLLDAIQVCNLALLDAIATIDPSREGKASTYFGKAMRNALGTATPSVKAVSGLDYALWHRLQKARRELQKSAELNPKRDPNYEPPIAVLAEAAGFTVDTANKLISAWSPHQFELDAEANPDAREGDSDYGETRADRLVSQDRLYEDVVYSAPYAEPDAIIEQDANRARVQALFDGAKPALTEDERCCLRLYYGMVDGREHTLGEVAMVMNVSRVRARSLKDSGLKKLKRTAASWTEPLVKNTLASAEWKLRNGVRRGRS